jgi:hypothetical protein
MDDVLSARTLHAACLGWLRDAPGVGRTLRDPSCAPRSSCVMLRRLARVAPWLRSRLACTGSSGITHAGSSVSRSSPCGLSGGLPTSARMPAL